MVDESELLQSQGSTRQYREGIVLVTRGIKWGLHINGFPIWLMMLWPETVAELHIQGWDGRESFANHTSSIIQNSLVKIGLP